MKLKIVVLDLQLTRMQKMVAAGAIGGVALLAARIGTAQVEQFSSGETLTADKLNGNFADLDGRIAALEAQPVGETDCPVGYLADPNPPNPANPESILCVRGDDEVVKVGTGSSSFWIDRYEASVWNDLANPTIQYGASADDYPNTFPDTGQWTSPLYALSVTGQPPSARLTWFQAEEACRASGKRLPTNSEWQAAARGTPDPGSSDGAGGTCVTQSPTLRETGGGTACVSRAGAQDMVGNAWELVAEWAMAPSLATSAATRNSWPTSGVSGSYAGDMARGLDSFALPPGTTTTTVQGLPAAITRGGARGDGTGSGLFAVDLAGSPAATGSPNSFRCVVVR